MKNVFRRKRTRIKMTRIEHIILDMDGTLVGEGNICARPGLGEFLEFLFDNFETVSIWTAANQKWYDKIYTEFIKPNMPLEKTFSKVWVRNMCEIDSKGFPYKPLSKFIKEYEVSRENTVIIDNDPCNYVYDEQNAIPIKTYFGTQKDTELFRVMNILKINVYYDP